MFKYVRLFTLFYDQNIYYSKRHNVSFRNNKDKNFHRYAVREEKGKRGERQGERERQTKRKRDRDRQREREIERQKRRETISQSWIKLGLSNKNTARNFKFHKKDKYFFIGEIYSYKFQNHLKLFCFIINRFNISLVSS